jgi:hypothetical protein
LHRLLTEHRFILIGEYLEACTPRRQALEARH